MDVSISKIGKVVIKAIFPFFKKSKTLELIKNDALEVSDDLLAGFYDKIKPIFVNDDRKPILDQLYNKPDDKIWQGATENTIREELEKNEQFFNEMKSYVEKIENSFPTETINRIYNIKGDKNRIEQGQHSDGKTKNTINRVDGNENTIIQG